MERLHKKEKKRDKTHGHRQQCGDYVREGRAEGDGGEYGGINGIGEDLGW